MLTISQRHKRLKTNNRITARTILVAERANDELKSAEAFYNHGRYDSAVQKFMKILKWAQKHNNKKVEFEVLQKLQSFSVSQLSAENIAMLKNTLLAYKEENKLKEVQLRKGEEIRRDIEQKSLLKDSQLLLKDSLLQTHTLLQEALLKENRSKDSVIKLQNELYSLELKSRKKEEQLRLSMEVGLTIALLLGLIIFYQYRKQKIKNQIIEKQKEELQTLMKEIHHRVKNNLQVISSLLDLQSQLVGDSKASAALKEGKNRVLSMALIHQNLYGEHSIQGINVKDYIDSLAKGLIDSYNIKPGSIKINTAIEELVLDVDTVIPLGLILNELVSNILKHAFNKDQNGESYIELKQVDDALVLTVKDNGKGFPDTINSNESTSFGIKLIKTFARKLKAEVKMYNEGGACTEVHILKYKRA
jgi:two-component sensor histidine kinase